MSKSQEQLLTDLTSARDNIVTSLENKGQQPSKTLKISEVSPHIRDTKTGSEVTITITATGYENGDTLTATLGDNTKTGTVQDGICKILVDEEGTWTVSDSESNSTEVEVEVSGEVELKGYTVFGIRVTKGESDPIKRITPLEDLVGLTPVTVNQSTGVVDYGDMQDTFLFKALNHVVALSIDGQTELELDPNDYSKLIDGETAPNFSVTSNYNIFARADKLYTYQYSDPVYEYYYISDTKVNENYVPNGFYNATGENDYAYTGVYVGSYDSSSRLRSVSGQRLKAQLKYNEASTASKKNGNNYYMDTHAVRNLYEIAYLCMFQNDNCSTALGTGRTYNNSNVDSSAKLFGETSGFANTKGAISYDTSSKAIKFMHIEDFWSMGFGIFAEGYLVNNSNIYVKMRPPYSNTSTAGYTIAHTVPSQGLLYISASKPSNSWGRIPCEYSGSASTYQCSFTRLRKDNTYFYVPYEGYQGIWGTELTNSGNNNSTARLTYIPEN